MLETLAAAVPGTPCWNFGPPPRLVDFWIRRQAIETAVHRWDVLEAMGQRPELAPALAADGIDEVAISHGSDPFTPAILGASA